MRPNLRKSVKYLIICLANLGILTILLALWTDDLQMDFRPFVRPLEFLRILAFSFLSLIVMRFYSLYLRNKGITRVSTKIKGAVVLTALVSSYLYVIYIQRIVSNVIINGSFRRHIAEKIKPSTMLAYGTQAAGLSNREYRAIAALTGFPSLSPAAGNIEYRYSYDGFLPDYSLELSYDVPRETPIAAYNKIRGNYEVSQQVNVTGAVKRVTYFEGLR